MYRSNVRTQENIPLRKDRETLSDHKCLVYYQTYKQNIFCYKMAQVIEIGTYVLACTELQGSDPCWCPRRAHTSLSNLLAWSLQTARAHYRHITWGGEAEHSRAQQLQGV